MRPSSWCAAALLALAACGSRSRVEFGPEDAVPRSQRPLVFGADSRTRLMLRDMGPARADTPAGWEQLPAEPERFRDLYWRVAGEPETECYLTASVRGGISANVGRWYGQFGQQPPASLDALPAVQMLGRSGHLLELAGTFAGKEGFAMLLAFVADGDRLTTLKFTGPQAVVQGQRAAFLGLVASLRQDAGAADGDQGGNADAGAAPRAPSGAPAVTSVRADTPAGWEQLPAEPGRFRDLYWRVAGERETECYLTAKVGGGLSANVGRWYGQFGQQPPASLDALPAVQMLGRTGHLLELEGTFAGKAGFAMLLAFVADGDQLTTLKFTGPQAVVQGQRAAFLGLVASLRQDAAAGQGDGALAAGHPVLPEPPAAPAHGDLASEEPVTAKTPSGWTRVPGSNRALHHRFGTAGEVYVAQLGGDLRMDLDVWRGEMGQDKPLDDAAFAALPRVRMLGADAVLLDLEGTHRGMDGKETAGARLLVAAAKVGGGITFAKCVGPAAEVEAQRSAFLEFCASLRAKGP